MRLRTNTAYRCCRDAGKELESLFKRQRGTLEEEFAKFDANKDGSITCDEFRTGMARLNVGLTIQQIEDLLMVVDKDGSGSLDYTEFMEMFGDGREKLISDMIDLWAKVPGCPVDRGATAGKLATEITLIACAWSCPDCVEWPQGLSAFPTASACTSEVELPIVPLARGPVEWSDSALNRLLNFDASIVLGTKTSADSVVPPPGTDFNDHSSGPSALEPLPLEALAARLDSSSKGRATGLALQCVSQNDDSDGEEAKQNRLRRQHENACTPWRNSASWHHAAVLEAGEARRRALQEAASSRWCFDRDHIRNPTKSSPYLAQFESGNLTNIGTSNGRQTTQISEQDVAQATKIMTKVRSSLTRAKETFGASITDDPHAVFAAIDTDNSGSLDRNELMIAFRKLGAELSKRDVNSIFQFCDTDGNGTIDKREFILLVGADESPEGKEENPDS